MPYVLIIDNRYVCEHSCGRYHYGDMSMVRECCINDYAIHRAVALEKAMTNYHPAIETMRAAYNSLTDAERKLAPRPFRVDYHGEIQWEES